MTKMDMVWVATARLLYPKTAESATVTRTQIQEEVDALFGSSITPVMIDKHLVHSIDRMADKNQPERGGSRNRYLVRNADGFRLFKRKDAPKDGWEKTGPTHPNKMKVDQRFINLVDWYESSYQ